MSGTVCRSPKERMRLRRCRSWLPRRNDCSSGSGAPGSSVASSLRADGLLITPCDPERVMRIPRAEAARHVGRANSMRYTRVRDRYAFAWLWDARYSSHRCLYTRSSSQTRRERSRGRVDERRACVNG